MTRSSLFLTSDAYSSADEIIMKSVEYGDNEQTFIEQVIEILQEHVNNLDDEEDGDVH